MEAESSSLRLWRRSACQNHSKALNISSATVWIASDLLKALAFLSDTTLKRSAVDREDLKPYWKSEKRAHFLDDQQSYYLEVSQRLLTTERRLTGWKFLAVSVSPASLNTGTTNETLEQSGKQDSFRHLLKSAASM